MRLTKVRLPAIAIFLSLIVFVGTQNSTPAKELKSFKAKEKSMLNEHTPYLPFSLNKNSDFNEIKIRLVFEAGKPNEGRQEICISGSGKIDLFFSRSSQDKNPRILEGNCDQHHIIRLLDFMEGNGIMDAESVAENGQGSRRFMELILLGKIKRIYLDEANGYSIQQIVGAIKLAAGQCLPDALNHRFFPNL